MKQKKIEKLDDPIVISQEDPFRGVLNALLDHKDKISEIIDYINNNKDEKGY